MVAAECDKVFFTDILMSPLTNNRNWNGSAVHREYSATPRGLICMRRREGRYTIHAGIGDRDEGIDTDGCTACTISTDVGISVQLESIRGGGRVFLPLDPAVANLLSDTVSVVLGPKYLVTKVVVLDITRDPSEILDTVSGSSEDIL